MKNNNLLKLLIVLTILSSFTWVGCQNPSENSIKNNKESFRDKPVQFTKHARCLMVCKHLSEREIEKLISNGKINSKECFPKDKPCPTYAVEGLTNDSQNVRVVVGECAGTTRVITVINLAKDYQCNCN